MTSLSIETPAVCPCGSSSYLQCCGALHQGTRIAATAGELMRSRYSAFVKGEVNYLVKTQSAPWSEVDQQNHREWCSRVQWLSLTIKETSKGMNDDAEGTVTFEARYLENKKIVCLAEKSSFQRLNGVWIYTDGEAQITVSKPERQSNCPCGSGKTFKKCHEKLQ